MCVCAGRGDFGASMMRPSGGRLRQWDPEGEGCAPYWCSCEGTGALLRMGKLRPASLQHRTPTLPVVGWWHACCVLRPTVRMRKLEEPDYDGCLCEARGYCVDLGPSAPPAVQPGGYWVNLGPLLYHWAESWAPQGEQMSIELSLEDVLSVCQQLGFDILRNEMVEAGFMNNKESMISTRYNCAFWTMVKREQGPEERRPEGPQAEERRPDQAGQLSKPP